MILPQHEHFVICDELQHFKLKTTLVANLGLQAYLEHTKHHVQD